MIEIEVKLRIKDVAVLEKKLLEQGYKLIETLRETDTYFDGGINGIKKSGQALRVRRTFNCVTGKEQSAITFKGEKIDTVSMARLELETAVENGEVTERILCALGFYPVQPIVVKIRKILRNGDICACLDDVQELGTFLELEIMAESEEARPAALERIAGILNNIGYTMDDTTRVSYLSQLQKQAGESQIVTSPVYISDR
jgi:adenylate cyclase class 2